MNRTEAIKAVGIKAVQAVEAETCEPTNRVYNHDNGEIEWSAAVKIDKNDLTIDQFEALPIGENYLKAIYYTDAQDANQVEANGGDWGGIDWTVHHYAID